MTPVFKRFDKVKFKETYSGYYSHEKGKVLTVENVLPINPKSKTSHDLQVRLFEINDPLHLILPTDLVFVVGL